MWLYAQTTNRLGTNRNLILVHKGEEFFKGEEGEIKASSLVFYQTSPDGQIYFGNSS